MMSKFPREILGDIIVHQKGSPFKSKDYQEYGVPVVRVSNLTDDSIDCSDLKFVSEHIAQENQKVKLKTHDVIIATVGSWPKNPASIVGKTICVPSEMNGALMNQNSVILRVKNECEIDQKYLFIALKTKLFSQHLISNAQGSANQASVTLSDIFSYEIEWPEPEIRKKVVSIIDSINQKIEINRQTNQTLEQIAQAIFKSWFVDFEPTRAKIAAKQTGQDPERAAMAAISGKALDQLDNLPAETQQQLKTTAALFPDALVDSELGEIPEGWEISELGDMLDFNPKRTLKKGVMAPYLDMKNVPTQGHLAAEVYLREMASGTKFINGDTLLARITPCLENGKTAYVDFLEEDQVAWGSTEYIVMRPKNGRPMSLGYIIARLDSFRSKAIQTMTGTSGRQRANSKALSEQAWIDYPLKLLHSFDLIAGAYLAKAKKNGDENKTLSELRDSLLPQLLSGDLPIGNKGIE